MIDSALFWNAGIQDLKRGFTQNGKSYICIICGEAFEQGVIYPADNRLLEAEMAVAAHVASTHPPMFEFFLELGRIYTGLSESQTELAKLFYMGHSDKEILAKTNANSASTIRNQRFSIREKYKQAKILVALVELMEESMKNSKHGQGQKPDTTKLVDFHPRATCVDERFAITQTEKAEVLTRYFDSDNKLRIKGFPVKEKKKIIILQKLMENFAANRDYTEQEVNAILQEFYEDFVTVRRYLVQYGFMDREKVGNRYWVKL